MFSHQKIRAVKKTCPCTSGHCFHDCTYIYIYIYIYILLLLLLSNKILYSFIINAFMIMKSSKCMFADHPPAFKACVIFRPFKFTLCDLERCQYQYLFF